MSVVALSDNLYYCAGAAISLSLIHGGPAPQCLSKMLYSNMVSRLAIPEITDINDDSVREPLVQVNSCCNYIADVIAPNGL